MVSSVFTINQTCVAFRAGQRLNEFEWHGAQAWMLGDANHTDSAVRALEQLLSEVFALGLSGQNEDLRDQIVAFRDRFPNEVAGGHLGVLRHGQDFDEYGDEDCDWEACRQFHAEVAARRFVELLKDITRVIETRVVPEALPHLHFGRAVDRGVRPDGIYGFLYRELEREPVREPVVFPTWTKDSPPPAWFTSTKAQTAEPVLVNRLANTSLTEADVRPRPGWDLEIRGRWQQLFPTRSLAAGVLESTGVEALIAAYKQAVRGETYVAEAARAEAEDQHGSNLTIERLGLTINPREKTASRLVGDSPQTETFTNIEFRVLQEILRFDVGRCPRPALSNILNKPESKKGIVHKHVSNVGIKLRRIGLELSGEGDYRMDLPNSA